MQEILSPENTSVQERAVSIKVLTVGSKQVTQALYRQLIEEELVDWEGHIDEDANIWGRVNVCTRECKGLGKHFHVVYEKHGELRRSSVSYGFKAKDTLYADTRDNFYRTYDAERKAELQEDMRILERDWLASLSRLERADQLFIAVSGVWK